MANQILERQDRLIKSNSYHLVERSFTSLRRRMLSIVLILLGLYSSLFANEFTVKSFEKINNDLSARRYERKDVNDIPCAIIKILTDISKPFVFDANLGIEGDVEYQENNEIWLYVSEGERQLTVAKDRFITLNYALPQRIEQSVVYSLVLSANENKVSVVILSDPEDAEKFIDGKSLGTGSSFDLEMGSRQLEIRKTGYKTYIGSITIDQESTLFKDIQLDRVRPVMITITSKPDRATIYINYMEQGQTDAELFKLPGLYMLKITKNKFETIEENIIVTETGKAEWNYNLVNTTGMLTIKTIPADAKIFINGERKTGQSQELAPGRYQVEVKRAGWEPETRTINVEQGLDLNQAFTLIRKIGKLQFTIEPMEARVVLQQGDTVIDSWAGSKYKKRIPVGQYQLQLSAAGYSSESKTIAIEDGKTSKLEIKLTQSARAVSAKVSVSISPEGTVTDIDGNVYKIIKIGNQVWMAENLKVTHYRNGDKIATGHSNEKWKKLKSGAFANYSNEISNVDIYGRLYNWYAVADSRKIAPKGWHVPTDAEWGELEMYLGMTQSEADNTEYRGTTEGSKLAGDADLWSNGSLENVSEFGSSGFTALPGGWRSYSGGDYNLLGSYAYFWSASGVSSYGWGRNLNYRHSAVLRRYLNKRHGFAVRCVKD